MDIDLHQSYKTDSKEKKKVTGRKLIRPIAFATFLLVALGLLLYPQASQWWNERVHAKELESLSSAITIGPQERLDEILKEAHQYNQRLVSGLETGDYMDQVNPNLDNVMGRIKIDKINVDLPIYHTSSDEVLKNGAGHMEETTLPVGGQSTHAAITAHRGLATSKLFTDLDQVEVGDQFTIEILGEALVYEVKTKRIVDPTETDWLRYEPGRDLVTLITCDPLGINTERMLVTGERVLPTPTKAVEELGAPSNQPGFPMWAVYASGGLVFIGTLTWWLFRPKKAGALTSSPT